MTIRRLLSLVSCLAWCLPALPVHAQVSAFRYQPRRVPVGTVFHYVKTNIDGSHPEQIALYVAGPDRIEAFKYHPGGSRAALVSAQMDWELMSAVRLESHAVWRDSTSLMATLVYDRTARAVDVMLMGRTERVAIATVPFHVYNFDLASLNVAFPHLRNPEGGFTVGLADPTFKDNPLVFYRGEVDVRFDGEERRGGAACRVYRIDGPGLEGKGGTLWVRKGDGFIQDLEIALPDNPEWASFKLRLERRENLTPARWEAFQRAQFGSR